MDSYGIHGWDALALDQSNSVVMREMYEAKQNETSEHIFPLFTQTPKHLAVCASALQMPISLHLTVVAPVLILQHQLNHPINTPLRKPKLHNLQPRPLRQLSPLLLIAL